MIKIFCVVKPNNTAFKYLMLKINFARQFVLILCMSILLTGFFSHMSNISLAQTTTDASVTNSMDSFLTHEDPTNLDL